MYSKSLEVNPHWLRVRNVLFNFAPSQRSSSLTWQRVHRPKTNIKSSIINHVYRKKDSPGKRSSRNFASHSFFKFFSVVFQCLAKKVFVINITRNRESIGLLAGKEKWRRGASVLREGLEEAETKREDTVCVCHIFGHRGKTVTTEFFLLKPRHLTTSSEYNQLCNDR